LGIKNIDAERNDGNIGKKTKLDTQVRMETRQMEEVLGQILDRLNRLEDTQLGIKEGLANRS
jgi:hypothetical protein